MATQNIVHAADQLKSGLADGIEKLKDFSENVKDRFESARVDVKRGIDTTQAAVKDAARDARRQVRTRPLTALAATAIAGLVLGFTAGWLVGNNRHS